MEPFDNKPVAKMIVVKYDGYGQTLAKLSGTAPKPPSVVSFDDKTIHSIKSIMENLLINQKNDYILINLTGSLYVCEKHDEQTIYRRKVEYHPYKELIKI